MLYPIDWTAIIPADLMATYKNAGRAYQEYLTLPAADRDHAEECRLQNEWLTAREQCVAAGRRAALPHRIA